MLNKKEDHFVSIADSFHPSLGGDALDPAARQELEERGRWGAVWAEATVILDGDESTTEQEVESSMEPEPNPVLVKEEEEEVNSPSLPCQNGHCMDILVGSTLTIGATAATFGMELGASIVYMLAVGWNALGKACLDIGGPLQVFYFLFFPLSMILLFVDGLLLTVSILLTEILAFISFILCFLFGGPRIAREWHQYIRRICHLVRWAFRSFHQDWSPERLFGSKQSETFLSQSNEILPPTAPHWTTVQAVVVDQETRESLVENRAKE